MEFSLIKDGVIALAAFIGAGLGIYNFISVRIKEKLKLEVIPKAVLFNGYGQDGKEFHITTPNRTSINGTKITEYVAIEIINLSEFDVTISVVGFGQAGTDKRLTIADPIPQDKGEWPRRLKSRESVTVYGRLDSLLNSDNVASLEHAFAETACNNIATGSSVALNQLLRGRNA